MKIFQTGLCAVTAAVLFSALAFTTRTNVIALHESVAAPVHHQLKVAAQHTSKQGLLGYSGGATHLASWSNRSYRGASNYVANVDNLERWNHFPLTVSFRHDSNYTRARQAQISAGFRQWSYATGSLVGFRLVAANAHPDVVVRCDPDRVISQTDTDYDPESHVLSHATITMGLSAPDEPGGRICASDLRGLAAHEFGHALGINGHSDSSRDLMYPSLGDNNHSITTRDLNTLRIAYRPVSNTLSQ